MRSFIAARSTRKGDVHGPQAAAVSTCTSDRTLMMLEVTAAGRSAAKEAVVYRGRTSRAAAAICFHRRFSASAAAFHYASAVPPPQGQYDIHSSARRPNTAQLVRHESPSRRPLPQSIAGWRRPVATHNTLCAAIRIYQHSSTLSAKGSDTKVTATVLGVTIIYLAQDSIDIQKYSLSYCQTQGLTVVSGGGATFCSNWFMI